LKVIGVPDERQGEEVCAWIKLRNKDSKVTVEEMRKFCKDNVFIIIYKFNITFDLVIN
jgi:fatty-acyl-CoA synthase